MKKKNKLVKELVSVLIPVYNVEKYLPDLFLSIENQTYRKIEVIFVNDGSTDNSLKLLKGFCNKHSYARVISQKNMGLPSARNTGIKYACGEYVYIADSDDVLNINAIDIMVEMQQKTNADIVTSDFNFIDNDTSFHKTKQQRKKQKSFKLITDNNLICSAYLSKFKSIFTRTIWNKLYKTEIIQSLEKWPNVWDKNIIGGEDNYFISKYLLKCKSACCIKDNLYFYRQRNNSITNESFNPNYYSYMFSLKTFFQLDPIKYKKTIRYAKALKCWFAFWLLRRMYTAKYFDMQKATWLYNEYFKYLPERRRCTSNPFIVMKTTRDLKKIYKNFLDKNKIKHDKKRKN